MNRADRRIIVDALRAQLPAGWTAKEVGTVILVRGPECPEDPCRNHWGIGSGPKVGSYPAGQNIIWRMEEDVDLVGSSPKRYAEFRNQRGWRDSIVMEMIRLLGNPPLTPQQRRTRG